MLVYNYYLKSFTGIHVIGSFFKSPFYENTFLPVQGKFSLDEWIYTVLFCKQYPDSFDEKHKKMIMGESFKRISCQMDKQINIGG